MSNNDHLQYLKFEFLLLLSLTVVAWIVGNVTEDFSLGLMLSLVLYVIWHWVAFFRLFHWVSDTSRPLPSLFGFWNYFIEVQLSTQFKVGKTKSKYKQILKQLEITTKAFPDATVLINEKNRVEWSNDTAFSLLGVSEKARGFNILKVLKSKEIERLLKSNSSEAITMKHLSNPNITLSLKIIQYSKKQRLLLARDISQQMQLQKTRRSFVANASHELRTPLTVITGYLEILQADQDLMNSHSLPVTRAMEQAQRMNSIIDDLLELSKIEQSKTMQSDKDEINMAKMLTALVGSLESLVEEKKAQVIANFDSMLNLKGNKNQIHSLSENLIKNALIHNNDGVEVDVSWKRNESGAPVLIVRDNGYGIPHDQIQHITERFYRGDNPEGEKVPGTGLGLAIVKHIVNFHEAQLEVESKEDFGTSFIITFPEHRRI